MEFTKNPVRIFFAIFITVWVLSYEVEVITQDVFMNTVGPSSIAHQNAKAHKWAADNCKELNITDIDVENFVDGCYYFQGHLKIEGNVTVPPLPETTQCNTIVAYNYAQTYTSYLKHGCGELGQHPECHDYNPACKQDYNDWENEGGFGYRIVHGWLPSDDHMLEAWYSLIKTFELEKILAQNKEWKEAFMAVQPMVLKVYPEVCMLISGNDPTICPNNLGHPAANQLNHTSHSNLYVDQVLTDSMDEGAIIPNIPENLKIYDIGKTDGNAIHLNLKMGWDFSYDQRRLWRERLYQEYGDKDLFTELGIGTDRGLFWAHRSQTPEDKNRKGWRDSQMVTMEAKVDFYQSISNQVMFKLAKLAETAESSEREGTASPVRNMPPPPPHTMGDVVSAPNPLGDSFYADADLETIRLNGTTPIASGGPYTRIGSKIPMYPVIWGPQVLAKLQANGGEFTDAEFKALPEYGSPDPQHFPLASNISYWSGTDNCPHAVVDFDGPTLPKGSLRLTANCRIREPTGKNLHWLGLVHKKNNDNGDTMLLWNPISFSNETNSDATKLANATPSSFINPMGEYLEYFQKRAGWYYPHRRFTQYFFDVLVDKGSFYGYPWFNNPLDQNKSTGTVYYYMLWQWFQFPFVFDIVEDSNGFDMGANIKEKADMLTAQSTKSILVNSQILALAFLGFAFLLGWEGKKKGDSEES